MGSQEWAWTGGGRAHTVGSVGHLKPKGLWVFYLGACHGAHRWGLGLWKEDVVVGRRWSFERPGDELEGWRQVGSGWTRQPPGPSWREDLG